MTRTATPFVLALLLAGAVPSARAAQSSTPEAQPAASPAPTTPASATTPSTTVPSTTLEAQAASAALAARPETIDARAAAAAAAAAPDAQQPGPPTPAPPAITVQSGAEVGVYSKYLWRGFVLADEVSMQPTYWVKFAGSLTVSSWMNVARQQSEGPLTEHDLTVDYSRTVAEKWTLSGGWINYVFPGLDEASVSNEVYAGVTHASFLNPTMKMYVDVHEGSGTYFNFSANHTFPLGSSGFAATPSLGLGYNHRQWIDNSAWSDANFGLKLTVPTPIKRLSLTPAIYYSRALDDDNFDSHFYGGIGIVTSFY